MTESGEYPNTVLVICKYSSLAIETQFEAGLINENNLTPTRVERTSVLTYECETWSMSRTDENISIYERKILFWEEFRKRERDEGEQILSSVDIKNLTFFTSSKYNELNGQVTLSEWTKTTPLKKCSTPNQLAYEEREG
ncbi:hypothetical protein TNCV_2850541 [Trichonephila clavipes]|nr:hypothetical protein TNCV_2850541 [Trichonephila clavipes]